MEREEFYAALCRTENDLEHSAKGTTWSKKNHKYIKKVGDVYIYAKDFVDSKITGKKYMDEISNNGNVEDAKDHAAINARIANEQNEARNNVRERFKDNPEKVNKILNNKEYVDHYADADARVNSAFNPNDDDDITMWSRYVQQAGNQQRSSNSYDFYDKYSKNNRSSGIAAASAREAKSLEAKREVALKRYYTKSLKGIMESTITKAKSWISNLFKKKKK